MGTPTPQQIVRVEPRRRISPVRVASSFLLLATLTGLTIWINHVPALPQIPVREGPCDTPPQWAPVYLSDPNAAQAAGAGWNFWGTSAVGAQVCSAGQLIIGLSPERAAGAPNLTVLLDGEWLNDLPVPTAQTVTVRVPRAGMVSLAYLNDYYRADVRSVEIQQVRSDVMGCQRLTPNQAPSNPRNTYVPQSDLLVLLDPDPISYTLCGLGTLRVRMKGTPAAATFPRVTVTQGSRQLAEWTATDVPTTYEVTVQAGNVMLNMINPYARQTADRNLKVTALNWQPQAPP